jgi:hypothetical protein
MKIREAFIGHLSSFFPSKIQREDQKIRLALTAIHNFHSDQEPKQILYEFLKSMSSVYFMHKKTKTLPQTVYWVQKKFKKLLSDMNNRKNI